MSRSVFRVRTRRPYPGRTYLYRLYAHDGRLLYIGISNSPTIRFSQHATGPDRKAWWSMVDMKRTTLRTFETRNDALRAEEYAIKTEGPAYNKVHNPDWHGTYRGEQPTDRVSRPLSLAGVCALFLLGSLVGWCSIPLGPQFALLFVAVLAVRLAWSRS